MTGHTFPLKVPFTVLVPHLLLHTKVTHLSFNPLFTMWVPNCFQFFHHLHIPPPHLHNLHNYWIYDWRLPLLSLGGQTRLRTNLPFGGGGKRRELLPLNTWLWAWSSLDRWVYHPVHIIAPMALAWRYPRAEAYILKYTRMTVYPCSVSLTWTVRETYRTCFVPYPCFTQRIIVPIMFATLLFSSLFWTFLLILY